MEHEILLTYSFQITAIQQLDEQRLLSATIDRMQAGLPFRIAAALTHHIFEHSTAFPCSMNSQSSCESVVHCMAYSPRPMPATTDTWLSAYAEDPETQSIIACLKSEVPTQWSKATLATIDSGFREYLRTGNAALVHNRLILYQQLGDDDQQLMLIVVPRQLRRDIFSAYHALSMASHMRAFKTLHWLRTRFF